MFAHYGLIPAETPSQAVDLAAGFAFMGDFSPTGTATAIFTASGGAGGWMADSAAAAGLSVPVLDAATRAAIAQHLPTYGASDNPVDACRAASSKIVRPFSGAAPRRLNRCFSGPIPCPTRRRWKC